MAAETKTTLTNETIEALQDLICINIDSRDGFREAAKELEDVSLSQLCLALGDERDAQAIELKKFVARNDEDPRREGSTVAAVHRCWMNIRDMFSSQDPYAVLAEAERGEDHIKDAYEDALKENPGSAVSDVLHKQFEQVKSSHDRIRDLREQYKN